ncbi:MAG TPA: 16S rRNA (guanine(966)-N(2))-methyltransferase RsmD [Dongiaceae bacterium]
MRIVGGKHRGRRIEAPPGQDVRPTSDRAREALFNILMHGHLSDDGTSPLPGARVLDAFAGSGALGLEALSRGAGHALFIENDAKACASIRANAKALGETANATVIPGDATKPPPCPGAPCVIVFLDPPYGRNLAGPALAALAARGWIANGAICVVELAIEDGIALPPSFTLLDDRNYGKARLLILKHSPVG